MCAMSGGVDSSVAAAVLVEQGFEVVGMTMRLYDANENERQSRGGTCCSPAEIDQAKAVCAKLGIPHYTVDERELFRSAVIDPFVREYASGRTPNPCTRCNQRVKFAPLLARARTLGAQAMATGHYARIEDGALLRAKDESKDQSYFLFAMGRDNLRHVRFPLGGLRKAEVRERARLLGFRNWNAPDSQELCFVPGGDHGEVVEREATRVVGSTRTLASGRVLDEEGTVIGHHPGIHRVTVGQKKGLRVAGSTARYVLRILAESRDVVVGATATSRSLEIAELHPLIDLEHGTQMRACVQIRHKSPPAPATVVVSHDCAHVHFDEPVLAAAPGQAAVVYDRERVLAGGWILASHTGP